MADRLGEYPVGVNIKFSALISLSLNRFVINGDAVFIIRI
ncbi:Hypothetical protein ETEE_0079 [Edwardsiella anguillarum ET080813]|uniref:Uncharacterized protein n=1 Tax=Edwardsiella anguillarum ET080813 TaxID=667120 RepID=A0A076LDJ4_9GAMM|nr:Hypothetical protein ETEE_0079 [Edwardsiella anguillarum ET080813]